MAAQQPLTYGFDIYSGSHGAEYPQGTRIDFKRVAAITLPDGSRKYRFVVVKGTEGTEYGNSWFEIDWKDAHDADFVCLAYHFARPSTNSGHAEADYHMNFVGSKSGGLLPGDSLGVLDSEDVRLNKMGLANADLVAHHNDFFDRIESALAFKALLYSGEWFMTPHKLLVPAGAPVDAPHAALAKHGFWGAQYGPLTIPTWIPNPWPFTAMRQYDDNAIIDGCPFPVLADVFYGTVDELKLYGRPAYNPDQFGGKLLAGPPDVALTDKGAAQDATAAAIRSAELIEQARELLQRGSQADILLATAQGNVAAIALDAGLLP